MYHRLNMFINCYHLCTLFWIRSQCTVWFVILLLSSSNVLLNVQTHFILRELVRRSVGECTVRCNQISLSLLVFPIGCARVICYMCLSFCSVPTGHALLIAYIVDWCSILDYSMKRCVSWHVLMMFYCWVIDIDYTYFLNIRLVFVSRSSLAGVKTVPKSSSRACSSSYWGSREDERWWQKDCFEVSRYGG